MMRAYLKECLYWLHLFFFKLRTFQAEAEKLSYDQVITVFLKLYSWIFLFDMLLFAIVGLVCNLKGISFNWKGGLILGGAGLFGGLLFATIIKRVIRVQEGILLGGLGGWPIFVLGLG